MPARTLLPAALACLALACLALAGCSPQPQEDGSYGYPVGAPPSIRAFCEHLSPQSQELASWESYQDALLQSLDYVNTRPRQGIALRRGNKAYTWNALKKSLEELLSLLPALQAHPALLAERFVWLKITPDTLFTGYYEPSLEASLTPSPEFAYPLYGVPGDLDKDTPYHDRRAIDQQGVLKGKGLEIAWLKNPVDGFFLQVQGSGRLSLPDGSSRHVLYAANNGRPYVSLGKVCIERGLATRESMSMPTLRAILEADSQRRDALLFCNPRYIFFRLAEDGPFGASGARLTPMVSAAVDRAFLPLGAMLMADALLPQADTSRMRRFSGLLLAQDTGAFAGNHVDLFCGHTPESAFLAGNMRGKAAFWILLSRTAAAESMSVQPVAKISQRIKN